MQLQRYYALLSGEHPVIPREELRAILEVETGEYRILLWLDGAAVFEARIADPAIITGRAGWVREIGLLHAIVEADTHSIVAAVRDAIGRWGPPGRVEVRRFKDYSPHVDTMTVKRAAGPRRGDYTLRVFITEGVAIVGRVASRLDVKSLMQRRPGKRPFFRPGPLMPGLTRAMINLSRMPRGGVFLDPFCGTGGFPLEACIIGARVCACFDIKEEMVKGSLVNLSHYRVHDRCIVAAASATGIPMPDNSVDALATDPPYGRSTSLGRREYEDLVGEFLVEAARVVRKGGYIVYAGPYERGPYKLAIEQGLQVVSRFHMHVHRTLIREVVVARR